MRKTILMFAAALLSVPVYSQQMIEAPMMAVANVQIADSGEFSSCGFKIVGIFEDEKNRHFIDVLLTINETGYGTGKLAGKLGPKGNAIEDTPSVDVFGGWIKADGYSAAKPINGVFAGEDPKHKLFYADMKATATVLYAVVSGSTVQIAIEWSPGINTVYFGRPFAEESHKNQFSACVDELMLSMKQKLEN